MTPPRPAPARVWFIQRSVEHYRIPVMDGLVERGEGDYEITYLGPLRDGAATGGERRAYLRDLSYRTRTILGQQLAWWPDAIDLVRGERPDVVVVGTSPRNPTSWRLPRACRAVGAVPVCWSKVHSFSGVPAPIMDRLKRRLFSGYELAIAYGRRSRDELARLGFPADRITVAQNTIDTRRIFAHGDEIAARGDALRREAGLADARVILCVGRMEHDKRHDDLLAAWPRLRAGDDRRALVLVGGGPRLEEIRGAASRVDPERILVTGRVPEGDDYAWIAAADLTVFPGAVGLAINQSLAFGRPTIIADEIGADTEILEHGRTGWRYPRGDVGAMVEAIESVTRDADATARITETARAMMRDDVTIDTMVEAIDATVRRALALRPAQEGIP